MGLDLIRQTRADQMVKRFLESKQSKPLTLLLLILKWDINSVETLRNVFIYFCDEILVAQGSLASSESGRKEGDRHSNYNATSSSVTVSLERPHSLPIDSATFMRFVARLHRHTRKIWPAALVSISHILGQYFRLVLVATSGESKQLDLKNPPTV